MTNIISTPTPITYSQFEKKWEEYSDIILQINKNNNDQEILQALQEQIKLEKQYPHHNRVLKKVINNQPGLIKSYLFY